MDGCPISFGPNLQSRPNPLVTALDLLVAAPKLIVGLDFDTTMDTNLEPANGSWDLQRDSAPLAIESQSWANATRLELTTANASAPVTDLFLELLNQDPGLHSDHLIPVLPFGPTEVQGP